MAQVNRYSDLSVSAYNPLSLQEIMMAPALKRQQHDRLDEYIINTGGLIKPDPLDVHLNEATQLKSEYDRKLQDQADLLAREGFNPNTMNSVKRMNREVQNVMSPTGRIGQINAAKQVYNANFKEYLEDATKNKGWSRERALDNWKRNIHDPYTGFDESKNIINIGQYGAPKKVETLDKLKAVKDLLGEQVIGEMSNSGYNLLPQQDGSIVMVDSSGRRIETSNKPNLQNALNLLTQQMNDKEWQDSIKFEGINPAAVQNEITYGINSMLSTKINDNRNISHSLHGYENGKKDDEIDLEAVNVEAVNIPNNLTLLGKLNGKGGTPVMTEAISRGSAGRFGIAEPDPIGKDKNKKVFDEAVNSQDYKNIANGLARNNKDLAKLKYNNPKMVTAVENYLKDNKNVVIQNRYVDPNTNKTAQLFASKEITKDKKATSELMLERAQQGAYEIRDEKGEVISPEDLGKYDFTYSGDMTPKSQIGKIFQNPKQNIGARRGVLIDKESKEAKKVYVSRSSDDFDTPQFKALETINSISKIADTRPGIYHRIKSPLFENYGIKNAEVKYNKSKNSYNLSFVDSNGVSDDHEFSDEEFQKFILDAYGRIGK